jgi:4-hydroxyphenylpyruvate dioxygenase
MTTTFFEPSAKPTRLNPLGIQGIDHVEFIVDDADRWRGFFVERYGMTGRYYADASTGVKGRRAHVVGQGSVNFILAEPQGESEEADCLRSHLAKHGCGVRDIAFAVRDAKDALKEATRRGAHVARPIDDHDAFFASAIAAYGDTVHTFITRESGAGFAPGYKPVEGGGADQRIRISVIDHVAANVDNADEWVAFYEQVFGFDLFMHFESNAGPSAVASKVVSSIDGGVRLAITEAYPGNSQTQEFLARYGGPGVQHIALLTPDIIGTVAAMRRYGQDFMAIPADYYDETFDRRVGEIEEPKPLLKQLGLLADRDHEGYLLQAFTQPVFPPAGLSFELIQRRGGAKGFGAGNFSALFETLGSAPSKRISLQSGSDPGTAVRGFDAAQFAP